MSGPDRAVRVSCAVGALLAASLLVGGALGMHRGLLLSDGIRGHFWPWAPALGRPALSPSASALSDPIWQFVPWVELARSELRAGRLPLWNPHQEAGQPLLGNAQSALGSPLLWPALALPLFPGWNVSLLLRLLVSASGGYLLARDLGRSRSASLLAASVCGLSGPFVAWLEHPHTLTAAAVPWLLLAVRRAAREEGPGVRAGVALTTALVLVGGHPETALMGALLATALLATGPAARRPVTRPLAGAHPIEAAAYLSLAALPLALAGAFAGRKERDTRTFVVASSLLLVAAFTNPLSALLASASTVRRSRTLLLLPIPAALLAARGVHAVTPDRRTLRTPILDRLAADPGTHRVLPLHTFLPANTATSLGLDDLRGYDALAVLAFRNERENVGQFRGVPTHTDVVAPWDLVPGGAELDAWNVKYLLLHPQFAFSAPTMNEKAGLDLEEVYSGPDGKLLLNRRVKPRARVEREGREEGAVAVLERTPTRWVFDVTAPEGGTLVVANAGYPGWVARVDGRRASIGGGVGRRQEVAVGAGRHLVEIAYRPLSFRLGLLLSILSTAALALPVLRGRLQRQ